MYRWIYNLLLLCVFPFAYLKIRRDSRYGSRWSELFGKYSAKTSRVKTSASTVWFHTVSVGEVIAATPVIKEMKRSNPNLEILLSTTTPTGAEQASKLGKLVTHVYAPLDFAFVVKRFVQFFQPKRLIIMETELWPNMLHYCGVNNLPVSVINARLSERSYLRYKKFHGLFASMAHNIDQFLCQYSYDAEHFMKLGVSASKVRTTGSVKFDISVPDSLIEASQQLRESSFGNRPVWIAASTHDGEDEIVLNAHKSLLVDYPNALLIVVPRHPQRFNDVFELSVSLGFETTRRSSHQRSSDVEHHDVGQVYVADTMGEMLLLLGAADVCFMAGSMLGDKVGGHNLLEPAALGLPILSGPSYYNFKEITDQLLHAEALWLSNNSEDIASNLVRLFSDSELKTKMGQQALHVVERNKGAVSKTVEALKL